MVSEHSINEKVSHEEYFDLFDSERKPLGLTHRRGDVLPAGMYHQVVEIWTFNSRGEILMTLRDPMKDAYPDYWENTGGSVLSGEVSLEAAVRELFEETGVVATPEELVYVDTILGKTAFYDIYFLKKDWPLDSIRLQAGETVDAKWVNYNTLNEMIAANTIAPPIMVRLEAYKTAFDQMRMQILKDQLLHIISQNPLVMDALSFMQTFELEDYYLGAGCIAQTVWNYYSGQPLTAHIKDLDLVYYDSSDLSEAGEAAIAARIRDGLNSLGIKIDVKNEARVHLWYSSKFGYDIPPYETLESAIDTWPTMATAVGLRMEAAGVLKLYAPFGLEDMFALTIRANKAQITEAIYYQKANKWSKNWPTLNVIPW